MAFQANNPFFAFLTTAARSVSLAEWAPAENYILEERLSPDRHQEFLNTSGFATTSPADVPDWFAQHYNYTLVHIAQRGAPPGSLASTFRSINQPALLTVQSAQDVVRVETLEGLHSRARSILSVDQVQTLITQYLAIRRTGALPPVAIEAPLRKWITDACRGGDSRPTFAAPLAEVEIILAQPDWANRLRDALGLGHIRSSATGPARVLLMRYSLERVRNAYLRAPAWAAAPTVLDDVARSGPNPCFFPAPETSWAGFGFTVDPDSSNPISVREILHAPIPYVLEDIQAFGLVTSPVPDPSVTSARDRHRANLKPHLRYIADVPSRP